MDFFSGSFLNVSVFDFSVVGLGTFFALAALLLFHDRQATKSLARGTPSRTPRMRLVASLGGAIVIMLMLSGSVMFKWRERELRAARVQIRQLQDGEQRVAALNLKLHEQSYIKSAMLEDAIRQADRNHRDARIYRIQFETAVDRIRELESDLAVDKGTIEFLNTLAAELTLANEQSGYEIEQLQESLAQLNAAMKDALSKQRVAEKERDAATHRLSLAAAENGALSRQVDDMKRRESVRVAAEQEARRQEVARIEAARIKWEKDRKWWDRQAG